MGWGGWCGEVGDGGGGGMGGGVHVYARFHASVHAQQSAWKLSAAVKQQQQQTQQQEAKKQQQVVTSSHSGSELAICRNASFLLFMFL